MAYKIMYVLLMIDVSMIFLAITVSLLLLMNSVVKKQWIRSGLNKSYYELPIFWKMVECNKKKLNLVLTKTEVVLAIYTMILMSSYFINYYIHK